MTAADRRLVRLYALALIVASLLGLALTVAGLTGQPDATPGLGLAVGVGVLVAARPRSAQ